MKLLRMKIQYETKVEIASSMRTKRKGDYDDLDIRIRIVQISH